MQTGDTRVWEKKRSYLQGSRMLLTSFCILTCHFSCNITHGRIPQCFFVNEKHDFCSAGWRKTKNNKYIVFLCHILYITHTHTHWEGVPHGKVYRYNPKHLCPKLNGYGDNGQRSLKLWQLSHTCWLPNSYWNWQEYVVSVYSISECSNFKSVLSEWTIV
jgi:hypothetical protein